MKSLINKFVSLGTHAKIWNACNIYGTKNNPIRIGSSTSIGSFTEIKPGVSIGAQCRIQSYVFISDGTIIDDNVFIGPRVIFLNDKYPTTKTAGTHNWTMQPAHIHKNVSIGGGAIIGPGVTIGESAVIGMGAVVVKNISAFEIVIGNPAKKIGTVKQKKYSSRFLP